MTYTYVGQMLMSLFRTAETAGIGGLFVTLTVLFSGILRPDAIPTFWIFMYWITPATTSSGYHYVSVRW
jgi:ABC-type multidrug transport system permease subunit